MNKWWMSILLITSITQAEVLQCRDLFIKSTAVQSVLGAKPNLSSDIQQKIDYLVDFYFSIQEKKYNEAQLPQAIHTFQKDLATLAALNPEYVKIFKDRISSLSKARVEQVMHEQQKKTEEVHRREQAKQTEVFDPNLRYEFTHEETSFPLKLIRHGTVAISTPYQGVIEAFDIIKKERLFHFDFNGDDIGRMAVSDNGKYLALSLKSNVLRVIDIDSKSILHDIPLTMNGAYYIDMSKDGLSVFVTDANLSEIYKIDLLTKKIIFKEKMQPNPHSNPVVMVSGDLLFPDQLVSKVNAKVLFPLGHAYVDLKASPLGNYIISTLSDKNEVLSYEVIDVNSLKIISAFTAKTLDLPKDCIRCEVMMSPDEKLIMFIEREKSVKIYDTQSKKLVQKFELERNQFVLGITLDGQHLGTHFSKFGRTSGYFAFFDVASKAEKMRTDEHDPGIFNQEWSVQFIQDGTVALTYHKLTDQVKMTLVENGKEITTYKLGDHIERIQVLPDEKSFIAILKNREVQIVDLYYVLKK